MNIEKYIESGVLEDYVMDLLEPNERLQVERYAEQYPEIRSELNSIEDALSMFAQANSIVVSDSLKGKIFHKIDNLETRVESPASPINNLKKEPKKRNNTWWPVLISAILSFLAVFSLLRYLDLKSDYSNLNTEFEGQKVKCDSIQSQSDSLRQQLFYQANYLELLRNQNSHKIPLQPLPNQTQEVIATVFYEPNEGTVLFDPIHLPAPTTNKQYQLWALRGDEKISLGIFSEKAGLTQMKSEVNADAFAISQEDAGPEKQIPDLNALYALGKAD